LGFQYGEYEFNNPYKALMVESLHQSDQGVFVHLTDILKGRKEFQKKLPILNLRMDVISKQFWYGGLHLPGGSFWTTDVNIQGHEYRSVLQVSNFFICCSMYI